MTSEPAGLKPGMKVASFTGAGYDMKIRKLASETFLAKADEEALSLLMRTMKIPGAVRVEGYLQIPADGIYTFHFGVSDEYRMTLGGVPVIEAFRGQDLMPVTREVKLARGLYPVTLECFRMANERSQAWATTDWEGPGLSRRDFLPFMEGGFTVGSR